MSGHTPGPLVVERCWDAFRTVASVAVKDPLLISVCVPEGQTVAIDEATAVANANIFSAAPDLLRACLSLLSRLPVLWGDNVHDGMITLVLDEEAVNDALAAISKARGRA